MATPNCESRCVMVVLKERGSQWEHEHLTKCVARMRAAQLRDVQAE